MDDHARARLSEFVAHRTTGLMRVAYLLTGDAHAAEDLVQSALVKTAARWRWLRNEDPEGYVRAVMLREHISWWRRLRNRRETPLGDHIVEVVNEDSSSRSDLRLVMRDALMRLTPQQRAVLVLRYYEDLSEMQIAEAWGCSIGTVRSRTHRAITRLRLLLPELQLTEACHERTDRGPHPTGLNRTSEGNTTRV